MKGFQEWATRHASVFGLTLASGDANAEMFACWEPIFEAAGYSAEELHQATTWIAIHCPPRFRTDHLATIRDGIHAVRTPDPLHLTPEQIVALVRVMPSDERNAFLLQLPKELLLKVHEVQRNVHLGLCSSLKESK